MHHVIPTCHKADNHVLLVLLPLMFIPIPDIQGVGTCPILQNLNIPRWSLNLGSDGSWQWFLEWLGLALLKGDSCDPVARFIQLTLVRSRCVTSSVHIPEAVKMAVTVTCSDCMLCLISGNSLIYYGPIWVMFFIWSGSVFVVKSNQPIQHEVPPFWHLEGLWR